MVTPPWLATVRRFLPTPVTRLAAAVHEGGFLVKQRRRMVRIAAYHRPPGDVDALLEAVQRKTLVFTITAGRTGTVYLQRLFALFPDTTSLHEPEPAYVSALRSVQHEPELARRFLLEWKLPFIAATVTRRYVETSHLFCKGFLEPALALGLRPRCVILRRSPRRIATSYLSRNAVPGRTKTGLKYLVHPGDPGVLPLPGWTRRSAYQLCFWYALEMERRQEVYAAELERRDLATVDVTAEELHDPGRFLAAAATLGLIDPGADLAPIRHGHAELSARIHNPNRLAAGEGLDLDADEGAVWDAIGAAGAGLRERIAARYAPAAPQRRAQGGSST
jgi:hypothetical protein